MVRRKHQPAVTAKMYRHFAVITVLVTGTLAIFADGGNRAAVAEEIREHEQKRELKQASVEKFGKPKLITSSANTGGSFDYSDSGFTGDGGGTFDASAADDSTRFDRYRTYRPSGSMSTRAAPIEYSAMGVTKEEFEKMSPAEQRALIAKFRAEREEQTKSLLRGSAGRSGGALEI